MSTFPHYRQPDSKDCGPTCLRIVAKYYGKNIPLQQLRTLSETVREGSSMLGLSEAAEKIQYFLFAISLDLYNYANFILDLIDKQL